MIKCADWVIDMGPEGGSGGGQIVAAGTPEDIAQAALFLASDHSAWISGIVVDVAGGVDGYSFS